MCNFSLVYQRYAGYKVVGLHSYWCKGIGWTVIKKVVEDETALKYLILNLASDSKATKFSLTIQSKTNFLQVKETDFSAADLHCSLFNGEEDDTID
jgi:hypothetical protein